MLPSWRPVRGLYGKLGWGSSPEGDPRLYTKFPSWPWGNYLYEETEAQRRAGSPPRSASKGKTQAPPERKITVCFWRQEVRSWHSLERARKGPEGLYKL